MFREFDLYSGNVNPFNKIGREWMLVCAGTENNFNMMTASWGGLGVLWNRNVCFAFVRPNRHTFKFMEENEYFTLSFFPESKKDILSLCGTKSGRDIDKMNLPGLTPVYEKPGFIYFSEASFIIYSRKIYFQDLDPSHFLDPSILENYPQKDFHRCYTGEIKKALSRL